MKLFLAFVFSVLMSTSGFAQIKNKAPYKFEGSSALGIPFGTTAQRAAVTYYGLYYNTDSAKFQGWNGTQWRTIPWTLDALGYTLPIATGTVLGGIKIGSGLSIDASGVVSVSASGSSGVTSVAMSSTDFTITGSPITTTGTLVANLKPSGVTAGTYNLANITVNAKGIVTGITAGSDLNNYPTSLGYASGNLTLGRSGLSSLTVALPVPETITGSNLGSTGASVFSGKVGSDMQFRRLTALGGATVTQNANDIAIFAPQQVNITPGTGITLGGSYPNITVNATPYTLPVATASVLGGVKQGSGITIAADGTISAVTGGGGTVTSVGLSVPAGLSVTGSPITGMGTIGITTALNGVVVGTGSGFSTASIGSPLTYSAGVLSIQTASSSQPGALAAADWTAFNAKVPASRAVNSANSIIGGGNLTSDRTLQLSGDVASPGANYLYGTNGAGTKGWYAIPVYTGSGAITVTGTAIGVNTASASQAGVISAGDYSTFTNKVSATRAVNTSGSLTGGGNLSADRTLSLVNDNASPGNSYYYGTNSSGTKGFYTLPTGESNTASNVGSGAGLWRSKTGANLEFRSVLASAPLTVNTSTNEISVSMSQASPSSNGWVSSADYNSFDAKVDPTRAVNTSGSLTGGGSLASDRTLTLVNDQLSPGSSYYYGTNSAGTKGYHALPSLPNPGSVFVIEGQTTFTATENTTAGQILYVDVPNYSVWQVTATYLVRDILSGNIGTYVITTTVGRGSSSPFINNTVTDYSYAQSPYGSITPNIITGVSGVLFRAIPLSVSNIDGKVVKVIVEVKQLVVGAGA